MADLSAPHAHPLTVVARRPHDEAVAALRDPGRDAREAIAWLSAHVAASARVLHPAARHALPDGRAHVRRQRAADRRLARALWLFDRRLTGDSASSRVPLAEARRRLEARLDEHGRSETALHDALLRALPPEAQRRLAARLETATAHAPTRPHPDTPHLPVLDRLLFRVDALVDRVRDGVDARRSPTRPAVPPPRQPGLWGRYLLGGSLPAEAYPRDRRRAP